VGYAEAIMWIRICNILHGNGSGSDLILLTGWICLINFFKLRPNTPKDGIDTKNGAFHRQAPYQTEQRDPDRQNYVWIRSTWNKIITLYLLQESSSHLIKN
jgi:hypothetical protein